MSDKAFIAMLVIAVTAIVGVIVAATIESGKRIDRQKAYQAEILGHPFTLHSKTFIGVRISGWDGTVCCIANDGQEIWVQGDAIKGLLVLEKP